MNIGENQRNERNLGKSLRIIEHHSEIIGSQCNSVKIISENQLKFIEPVNMCDLGT